MLPPFAPIARRECKSRASGRFTHNQPRPTALQPAPESVRKPRKHMGRDEAPELALLLRRLPPRFFGIVVGIEGFRCHGLAFAGRFPVRRPFLKSSKVETVVRT